MKNIDLNKSLEEIENEHWDKEGFDSTLIEKCYQLRKLPLRELNVESYRILIGQNVGLPYLIPLALKELQKDPLVEGDFYRGDLLCNVLTIDKKFWNDNKELISVVKSIVESAQKKIKSDNLKDTTEIIKNIDDAIKVFKRNI